MQDHEFLDPRDKMVNMHEIWLNEINNQDYLDLIKTISLIKNNAWIYDEKILG